MRNHNLKILNCFADDILSGLKNFEIRKNIRGFQKGDIIHFTAIDETGFENPHLINSKVYQITYVLNGWGLKNGYVVFGIIELSVN